MKTLLAIITGVVSALVVVFLAVAVIMPSQGETAGETKPIATVQVPTGVTPVETAAKISEEKSYDLQNVTTTWVKISRGRTTEDGILWVPEVRFKVKNLSSGNINKYFRVLFIDHDHAVSGDEIIVTLGVLPPGYTKGNLFVRGTIGYTDETMFWKMIGDESKIWEAEIFEGDTYRGPWTKIKTVKISLPGPFQQLKEAIRSDSGKKGLNDNKGNGFRRRMR